MIWVGLGIVLLVAVVVSATPRRGTPDGREPLAPGCGMRESVDPGNLPFFKPEWKSRRSTEEN